MVSLVHYCLAALFALSIYFFSKYIRNNIIARVDHPVATPNGIKLIMEKPPTNSLSQYDDSSMNDVTIIRFLSGHGHFNAYLYHNGKLPTLNATFNLEPPRTT